VFPGGKAWPGRDTDHSSPSSAKSSMNRSYTSSLPWRQHGGSGIGLLYSTHMTLSSVFVCEISGSRGGEYEDDRLLGYSDVYSSAITTDYTALYPRSLSCSVSLADSVFYNRLMN
jgi:hypothetical protein